MKQENTDRSTTQGDACQSKNRQEQIAQQLREKSAFINQVTNFAEYMQKEFIEPSDGEMGLIICAADRTYDKASDERTGACHIVLGGGYINTASLASMMQREQMQDLFRKTRRLADSIDGDRQERRNMLGAAMMGMLAQMAHRDRDDDDDE